MFDPTYREPRRNVSPCRDAIPTVSQRATVPSPTHHGLIMTTFEGPDHEPSRKKKRMSDGVTTSAQQTQRESPNSNPPSTVAGPADRGKGLQGNPYHSYQSLGTGVNFDRAGTLTSSNGGQWRRAMVNAMMKERVWDLVSGIEVEDRITPYGRAKFQLALAGIRGQLSDPLQIEVEDIESPSELWKYVENRTMPRGDHQLYNIIKKLLTLRLEDCVSMDEYEQKFATYNAELRRINESFVLPKWYLSMSFLINLGSKCDDFMSNLIRNDSITSGERKFTFRDIALKARRAPLEHESTINIAAFSPAAQCLSAGLSE